MAKRRKRMKTGKGWRLQTPAGNSLKAALLRKFSVGKLRFAIFRVVS